MKLGLVDQKQFLANIRKLAKERRISPQIMLQEIILDDLIDRTSNSRYKDNLVLKGGFLIASNHGSTQRMKIMISKSEALVKSSCQPVSLAKSLNVCQKAQ